MYCVGIQLQTGAVRVMDWVLTRVEYEAYQKELDSDIKQKNIISRSLVYSIGYSLTDALKSARLREKTIKENFSMTRKGLWVRNELCSGRQLHSTIGENPGNFMSGAMEP